MSYLTCIIMARYQLILAICVIFLSTALCNAKESYMILMPKNVRPCVDYVFTAQALNDQSYNLTAKFEGGQTLVENEPVLIESPTEVSLKIPCGLTRASYYVSVTGSNDLLGKVLFDRRQYVSYQAQALEIIIQTDKKVYKPGQIVHYRVFGVKPNLQVEYGEFEIIVMDPKGNKIQNFNSKGDAYGVTENELILSKEPTFGQWTIKASVGTTSHTTTFSIDKYVLPKAEAKVILPSFVAINDQSIKVKVNAQYTFQKPLSGPAKLFVEVDYYPKYRYERDPVTRRYTRIPIEQPKLEIDVQVVNGEGIVEIPLTDLQKIANGNSLSYKTIRAVANVTDQETGIVYNSKSVTTSIKQTREKISFPLNPTNYKPGLANTIYIELKQQDDSLITSPGMLSITAKYKREVTTTSTTTTTTTQPEPEPTGGGPVNEPVIEPIFMPIRPIYPYPYCPTPTYEWIDLAAQNISVTPTGIAIYELFVGDFEALEVRLDVTYLDNTDVRISTTLKPTKSPSNTFLSAILTTQRPRAGQNAVFQIDATSLFTEYYYTILSRGVVVESGLKSVASTKSTTLTVPLISEMAPKLKLVIYIVVDKGEIVADSISFTVDGVFKNKVSLAFEKSQVETGETSTLLVKAYKDSNVYAVAVDKSTTLLGAETDDHSQDVQDFLEQLDHDYFPYPMPMPMPMIAFRKKREIRENMKRLSRRKRTSIWWPYPYFTSGVDAEEMFRNTGLHVLTDALIYNYNEPASCYPVMYRMEEMAAPPMPGMAFAEAADDLGANDFASFEENVATRSFFPETFIFNSAVVNANGYANFTLNVPDTITSWVASAFAIPNKNDQEIGVGLTSDIATLVVSRKFFVQLNLPYSVIRGEEVRIQATVFNYLGSDTEAEVILENPKGYIVFKIDEAGFQYDTNEQQSQKIRIPSEGAKSVYFSIRPTELGDVNIQVYARTVQNQAGDRIIKPLLVEPEGVPAEYNRAVLIDLTGNTRRFRENIPIKYPSNMVPDTLRVVITAYGDPMATALNNLERLIRRPSGCGEQNMIGFVPNIYVRKYLEATGQITAGQKTQIKQNLEAGYTTQLNYQRGDGSFSAFGNRDNAGSQWLTAYVLRSFVEAQQYIYIDENIINRAARFLVANQNAEGAFDEPGRVIHKELRGSSFQGDPLVSFTLLALVEVKDLTIVGDAIEKAIKYLVNASKTMENAYDLAITAYALTQAHKLYPQLMPSMPTALITKLESKQVTENGQVYWKVVIDSERIQYFWNPPHKQSSPVNIEATSYALSLYAAAEETLKGLPVMSWLISQQNGDGGYSTSQDTVVALQALSEFASSIYDRDWKMRINVRACKTFKNWRLSADSATVQRSWIAYEKTDSIQVNARGTGRAVLMATIRYNIFEEEVESSFGLNINIISESKTTLQIQICAEWRDLKRSCGMATAEVGILSGYQVEELDQNEYPLVKRKEFRKRNYVLYFDEITVKPICVVLKMKKTEMIGKIKSAFVVISDYYNPENKKTVSYNSILAEGSDVCDNCIGTACDSCMVAKKRR